MMKTADMNTKLIDSYISLLNNMSAQDKLHLISKLSSTIEVETEPAETDFYKAFGAWDERESAEELISSIKGSRTFNREIEEF